MGMMFKKAWHNPQRTVCHISWYEMLASQTQPCSLATDQGQTRRDSGLGSVEHRRLYVRVKCNFCSFIEVSSTL